MSIANFLETLRARDIQVWVEGEQLRCSAPAGALSPELREELRRMKDEIVDFLRAAQALAGQQRAIVPLQPQGERTPVFAVAGHNGDVFCYRALVGHLGKDQPFYGLQPPGVDGAAEPLDTVEALAAYFAAQIRRFRPDGNCIIAGYCAGGTIAFELAQQLVAEGVGVCCVVLFGAPDPGWYRFLPQLRKRLAEQFGRAAMHLRALLARPLREYPAYFADKLRQRRERRETEAAAVAARSTDAVLAMRARVEATTLAAVRRYRPQPFSGHVNVIFPSPAWARSHEGGLRWRSALIADADEYCGPDGGSGDNMLREPYAAGTAELFRRSRERSEAGVRLRPAAGREAEAPVLHDVLGRRVQTD